MVTIKKFILLTLVTLMMVGCDTAIKMNIAGHKDGFNIIIVDSCEYIQNIEICSNQGYGYLAHKGNCKFCAERRKKELEELIIKLRKK